MRYSASKNSQIFLMQNKLKTHLFTTLILGLMVRLLTSYFDYGPFALDDYLHGLIPAHLLYDQGIYDLPEYRSWLLPWMLTGFLKLFSYVNIQDSLTQIRIMLSGLAIFSLIGIYGTYLYVKNFDNRRFQLSALYLVAIYPLVPLVATRAFGEAVAMSVLAFGFGVSENARFNKNNIILLIGLIIIGIACLLRFQVALLLITYALCLLIINWRRYLLPLIVSGLIIVGLQAIIDIESSRVAFSTVIDYLRVNEGGAAGYGATPWYSTWLLALAFIIAPFSLPLFRHYKTLWRRNWVIILPLFIFILAHSIVPHKEERFIFPIIILEIWVLAYIWSLEPANSIINKVFTWALGILGSLALLLVCFVNFQSGAIDPLLKSHADTRDTLVLSQDWNYWDDFNKILLNKNGKIEPVELNKINLPDYATHLNGQYSQIVIVSSNPELKSTIENFSKHSLSSGINCSQINYATSLLDNIAYTLNPSHNKRRAPAMYIICVKSI